jgi:hypothetical protein
VSAATCHGFRKTTLTAISSADDPRTELCKSPAPQSCPAPHRTAVSLEASHDHHVDIVGVMGTTKLHSILMSTSCRHFVPIPTSDSKNLSSMRGTTTHSLSTKESSKKSSVAGFSALVWRGVGQSQQAWRPACERHGKRFESLPCSLHCAIWV